MLGNRQVRFPLQLSHLIALQLLRQCEEGSTAEALISVCSSVFSGLTIQSLQSFDIGWDEWVNLPSDFTLQSRVKL